MVGKFYPDFHGSFIVLCIRMPAIIIMVNGEIDNSAATYQYKVTYSSYTKIGVTNNDNSKPTILNFPEIVQFRMF